MILSVCAALITINDNSCYFIINIFSGEVEVVSCSHIAGMLLCLLCWVAWYVCFMQSNIVYFMGGQLVLDWDRLENLLITRDRPVGNIVTNTKCQSWVSHVQIQYTIALVSDAQTEAKVSVMPKSWLPRNNRKTYFY